MTALALPLFCAVLLVIGIVFYRKGDRELTTSRASLQAALGARGLTLTGDLDRPALPPGIVLTRGDGTRAAFPADLALGGTNPITAPQLRGAVVVQAALALPDLVVCEQPLAQPVFGAFPPSAMPTGDASFDARFGIFPAPTSGAPQSLDYRSVGTALTSWATPEVRAWLLRTGFVALRITGGRAELSFLPTSPDGMALAIAATDAIAAASVGRPVPSPGNAQAVGLTNVTGAGVVFAMISLLAVTSVGSGTSNALKFQDAHEDAWFTNGGNSAACPDGGRYSAGPGFRKQHRTHYCYQSNGQKTPANDVLLSFWLTASFGMAAAGGLLVGRGIFTSAKAASFRQGNAALAS